MCGTEKKENTLTKHFSSIVFPFRYDAAQLETEAFNTAFSIGGASLAWNGIILAVSILVAVVVSGILVKIRFGCAYHF